MAKSMMSNQSLTLKGSISTALWTGGTFEIFETGIVLSAASIVFKNKIQLERMQVSIATDGTCTVVKRWLTNADTKVEDPTLKKEWSNGASWYVTMLASDFLDVDSTGETKTLSDNFIYTGDVEFQWDTEIDNAIITDLDVNGKSNPQPNFATELARDAFYTAPVNGDKCTVNGIDYSYNGTTVQWEAKWVSTPVPNASESAWGIAKMATDAEFAAGTDQTAWLYNIPKVSDVKDYVDTATEIWQLVDSTYMAGETITAWQCVFLETWPTTAQATTKQNISDVDGNTRVSFPFIGTWVASSSFKVNVCKTGTGHNASGQDLGFRLETDNSGSPSGTLVNPNAFGSIAPSALTTNLADTTITWTDTAWTDAHWVTLNVTEASQTAYKGVKITLTSQSAMISVDKDSDCTATKAYLYDTSGTLLTSVAFVANLALLAYSNIVVGNSYYILVGSDGSSYTSVKQTGAASYPYVKTKLDYVSGWVKSATETKTITWSSSYTQSRWFTLDITPIETCKLSSISRANTLAILKDSTWTTTLETSDASWVFSGNYILLKWVNYKIVVSWSWTHYDENTPSKTYASGNLNITIIPALPIAYTYSYPSTFSINTIWYMLDSTDINNIVDINYWGVFTAPAAGTKCHLVAFQWTYGSETVNATNYYNIGYSTNDTTTRGTKLYWGSSWGSVITTKFPYTSSTLFQDQLLSLTDADFAYKVDLAGISTESKAIGTYPKLALPIDWSTETNQIGMTAWAVQYLNATPWSIWWTAWTNICQVGIANTATKLTIKKRLQTITITPWASPYTWTNTLGKAVMVKISGWTVNPVVNDWITIATATWLNTMVPAGIALVITYSSAPTITYSDI